MIQLNSLGKRIVLDVPNSENLRPGYGLVRNINVLLVYSANASIKLRIACMLDCTEKDDLAQTGNDQNQTGLAVQIHLIRASKPANNIREFTDQSSILNRSHYRSPIAKYRYRTFPYTPLP